MTFKNSATLRRKTLHDQLVAKVADDPSKLTKKTNCDTKIEEIEGNSSDHDQYVTTPEFNKFSNTIFDEKWK